MSELGYGFGGSSSFSSGGSSAPVGAMKIPGDGLLDSNGRYSFALANAHLYDYSATVQEPVEGRTSTQRYDEENETHLIIQADEGAILQGKRIGGSYWPR